MPTLTTIFGRLALLGLLVGPTATAWADDDDARDLYAHVCSKCHGLITEDVLSWTPNNLKIQAVTMPLGPPLSGVYGREAGTMPNYPYSKSFTKAIANPWIWDEDSLDGWLLSTQNFIRGSTMFVKVEDDTERAMIIAYLKKYAQFTPE